MTFVRTLSVLMLILIVQFSHAEPPKVLVVGDSLSAAFGFDVAQGWVSLLQQELLQKPQATIVNASVSGETTSGGLSRLPALLKQHQPNIVILELGANDGLRGQPLKLMQENLQTMIDLSKAAGARVLLVGMQIPTNYGQRYTREFKASFPELAQKNQLGLVPFLLENVAAHSDLIQSDGLHPNALAQPIIRNNVRPHLEAML